MAGTGVSVSSFTSSILYTPTLTLELLGDNRNCYGSYSLTEFNLDAGGLCTYSSYTRLSVRAAYIDPLVEYPAYYDISNIEGFSVGQSIAVTGGQTVTCTSASCSCTQAYGIGSKSSSYVSICVS